MPTFLNKEIIDILQVSETYIEKASAEQCQLAAYRRNMYMKSCPSIDPKDKIAILVDDGLATGATMKAAISSLKSTHVSNIIVAVPVASKQTLAEIANLVDQAIALVTPIDFYAVGQVYRNFEQTTDEQVIALLQKAHSHHI